MAKFKDASGREWELRITLGLLPKLKAVGLDVSETTRKGQLEIEWMADHELLGKVLWVLCERQAVERGIGPEAFIDAIDGPTIHAAVLAYAECLADFSLAPEVAAEIRSTLPALDKKRQAAAVTALRNGLSAGAGGSPALPGSTATAARSAN